MADDKISEIASDDVQTDASVVANLTRLADSNVPVQLVTDLHGRSYAVHRNDFTVKDISLPNATKVLPPQTVVESVKLQTADSLMHYMNRFKNNDSLLFADVANNVIHGVIDYHLAEGDGKVGATAGTHNATLQLPYSKEWGTWVGSNEKLMSHVAFASFLEENALDVFNPHGAELLDLCRDLQVRQNMNFKASIRNGDTVSIDYQKEDDVATKSQLELPVEFMLAIPVYFDETAVNVRCLMRRKIDDGKLFLGYKMVRHENVRQEEFQLIVSDIEANTMLAAVYGTRR